MRMLIFAGAGTSAELSVPIMSELAEEFVAHIRRWEQESEIAKRIMRDNADLEYLIEQLDAICGAKDSIEVIWQGVDLGHAQRVRAEVEWFVQHCAERITSNDAWLMWSAVLHAAQRHDITIATTNYDRAIELAANADAIRVDDGFDGGEGVGGAKWRGLMDDSVLTKLLKLHGSTDWYTNHKTGTPTKLRHPMPLFGGGELHFEDSVLGSSLVLPSRYKVLHKPPYTRLLQAFLNAADSCEVGVVCWVIIGRSTRARSSGVDWQVGAWFVSRESGW